MSRYCYASKRSKKKYQRFIYKKLPLCTAIALLTSLSYVKPVLAGPEGGQVVGGRGTISQIGSATSQAGSVTIINQNTQRMAIDWNSYNVGTDERVQYIQPNSSSLSLNRILSHQGSQIHGRIDANGQVLLVNPNGIVFGDSAQVNVGGLLASGLNINPDDFMNGRFTFDSIEGKDGVVINSGTLSAATGGSISLLGKRVENNGLIRADLGRINLASGKKAVLSFDGGLMGIRVSEAVLQDELGVEAGVLNNGDLSAKDGQILLTGAASHDIFTQAMNTGDMHRANSVVVAEDGSFTLSAGGTNLVNTGSIDTSGDQGGEIVALGQNITSSGEIRADSTASQNRAGAIELHSITTTELTDSSITSTLANTNGQGDTIKLLGQNVGVLDNAQVDASGANGGGELLIGGDKTGANANIRNADFIYLGQNSQSRADAIDNGNGGKLITFASDTARIYGGLSARGGAFGGNGGFVETSGLKSFDIAMTPDVGANFGKHGEWLIDPYNIRIVSGSGSNDIDETMAPIYTPNGSNARISWNLIENFLESDSSTSTGGTVTIQTTGALGSGRGDIIFNLGGEDATLLDEGIQQSLDSTLIIDAQDDIIFLDQTINVNQTNDRLNLELTARNGSIFFFDNSDVTLNGGNLTLNANSIIQIDNNSDIDLSNTSSGGGDFISTSGREFRLRACLVFNLIAVIHKIGKCEEVTPVI